MNLSARELLPVPTVVPIPVTVPAKPATALIPDRVSNETDGNEVRTCGGAV